MNGSLVKRSAHPSLPSLSLYAGGDLPRFAAFCTRIHLRFCRRCRDQVTHFRLSMAELKRAAEQEILATCEPIMDWKRLEREMTGNITVGLAAARCIERVGRKRTLVLRRAVAAIALVALLIAGWFTHFPEEQNRHLLTSLQQIFSGKKRAGFAGTVLESTPDGIAVRTPSTSLTILHPPSATISLAGDSSLAASYIDEETGEVTITNVYAQ
jgi:hypothetical protein